MSLSKLRYIIPIIMQEVREPDIGPIVFIPECGSRWGKPSSFNFQLDAPTSNTPDPAQPGGGGETAYNRRTEEELEILTVPAGGDMETKHVIVPLVGYVRTIVTGSNPSDTIMRSTTIFEQDWLIAMRNIDLGDENTKEPVGVIISPDGGITERFQPLIISRILDLEFERR